jgi:signal transduction histidine kinase
MRLQRELLEMSEREQRRIGRELHDGLCQHLTGVALAGHALGQNLATLAPANAASAARLVELVEGAIEMTRSLSRGLNPVEIEVGRLADNFQELATKVSGRGKVACRFECRGIMPELDVTTATHLYRIAQEAAENAARHGRPAWIDICLEQTADELVLTVGDNGAGLPVDFRSGPGLGVPLMGYRADLIGGTFSIANVAGGGVRVTCTLPQVGEADELGLDEPEVNGSGAAKML